MPAHESNRQRTEENSLFAMQAAIVEAVQVAVRQAETQRVPLKDIDDLRQEVREGFREVKVASADLGRNVQEIKERLARGEGRFDVVESRLNSLEREKELREESRLRKSIGSTSEPHRAIPEPVKAEDDEKPLISTKIWNAIILAVITALGTALGVWMLSGALAAKDAAPATPPVAPTVPAAPGK